MTSLRITLLTSAFEMSGGYFRFFYLGKYLSKAGGQVSLIASNRKSTFKLFKKDGVSVCLLPSIVAPSASILLSPLSRLMTSLMQTALNNIMQITSDSDILHISDFVAPQNAAPLLLSRIRGWLSARCPRLLLDWDDWWTRGGLVSGYRSYSPILPLAQFLEEKIPFLVDAVTVSTNTLRRRALALGIKPENLFLIPNGANIEFIKPLNLSDARQEIGIPQENIVYTHVGIIDSEDLRLLLSAHKIILKHSPNALLVLIALRSDQIKFINSMKNITNVLCLERQPYPQIPKYLGASNILLLPMQDNLSNNAAFPIRLGDYLAAGRPIVATNLPELARIVSESGLLARPADPREFAKKILQLIKDKQLCEEMGRHGRKLAERKYSWEIVANSLIEVYRNYLPNFFG